jgi:hypothetical protein
MALGAQHKECLRTGRVQERAGSARQPNLDIPFLEVIDKINVHVLSTISKSSTPGLLTDFVSAPHSLRYGY